jgi:predicted enzyme related to lactoylglutathione lyase
MRLDSVQRELTLTEEDSKMNVTGVDFTIVPITDFERSKHFYGEVLGLEQSKQWGDMPAQEYETGNLTIAIMQPEAFGQTFSPNRFPLALQVDDVAEARTELESGGVEFTADTIDSGVCHMAFFSDPDGNGLMLHHHYAD